ncbi:FHA domain-containing protein [Microcoleus sp. FACHB-1515]|nr:FHA domain-containing protein [Microcoleus sp. FACHB-1515]MBD2089049.1 FHA domain-containing protein [Microcoleus sp. FACHB-1515]
MTGFQLVDVGSSNGTFLNGERLSANQPAPLRSNNVIKIGAQEWTFE